MENGLDTGGASVLVEITAVDFVEDALVLAGVVLPELTAAEDAGFKVPDSVVTGAEDKSDDPRAVEVSGIALPPFEAVCVPPQETKNIATNRLRPIPNKVLHLIIFMHTPFYLSWYIYLYQIADEANTRKIWKDILM